MLLKYKFVLTALLALLCLLVVTITNGQSNKLSAAQEGGSVGLEGRISADPPKNGATISLPRDGAVINGYTTTVSGICPKGLLVKVFKNNVFAGSVQCTNGSFSIQIDLFSGRNEIVVRVYDDLDQAGPDSNMIVVNVPAGVVGSPNRISLTSSFAKRGANPGQTLTWPITLSGGEGPYAITVDWGDGKTSDIISQAFAGTFNISHIYDSPGIYNVVIRATDKSGTIAFLQLVAVANGPASQSSGQTNNDKSNGSVITRTKILWQPAAIAIPLIALSFWLGRKYELLALRKRFARSEDIS